MISLVHQIKTKTSHKKESTEDDKNLLSDSIWEKLVSSSGSMQPYLRLIRFHKPIGSWLLFWPFAWSIALAADPGTLPDFKYLLIALLMCIIMRGAGCTINDIWDKNIDKKVSRTKDRPLAKEELSRFDALLFLGGQLGLGWLILLQFNFRTIALSALSMPLIVAYPLMKRLIPYPQVILGMAMNFPTLLGTPIVRGISDWPVCLPLYVSGICWTVVYDTIYAYQDIKDDKKLGLKSTAITFQNEPKLWLGGFGICMILFAIICGVINQQTWPFYVSVFLIAVHIFRQVYKLDTENAEECGNMFVSNQRVGLVFFAGIAIGNFLK